MALSERVLAAVSLLLRVLTLLLLIASLIIIVTNKRYDPFADVVDPPNLTFRDFYAYRYVLSAAVIGCAYTLLVLPFAAIHVAQGKRIGRGRGIALLIFTDVVFAVLIATGAAAFGEAEFGKGGPAAGEGRVPSLLVNDISGLGRTLQPKSLIHGREAWPALFGAQPRA